MEYTHEHQQQARNLYFNSDLSQVQIAELLNISRKTLYLWIRQGDWKRAKYTASHAPSILAEQYYAQLGAINQAILARNERPYPTKEESDIIRKLTVTIKHVNQGMPTACETMDVFTLFADRLAFEDFELTRRLLPLFDKHVKFITDSGDALAFNRKRRDADRFDQEYEEMIAQEEAEAAQAAAQSASLAPEQSPVATTELSTENGKLNTTGSITAMPHNIFTINDSKQNQPIWPTAGKNRKWEMEWHPGLHGKGDPQARHALP